MKKFFLMGAVLIMASTIQAIIPPRIDTQLIHQKIDSLILEKDIIQFKSDFFSSLIYLNDIIGYYNPEGTLHLFELTRHSDHHYKASRKYQILRHMPQSPQLPAGYPGSMLLSLVPPLWFRTVNGIILPNRKTVIAQI